MSQKTVEEAVAPQSHSPGEDPEGEAGQRPDPPAEAPGWLSQVPYFLVLATMAAGIVIVAAAYFKRGPALIAGALLLGAVFRFFLPPEKIGMLAVRSRWMDLVTLTTLAVLLIVLAWVAPQLTE
ncbi:DUF3017 domain-containing protein [Allosalinactinospora lopnorensis]|uniref:DUF3017 domain-containing protein n=1 Tax=Allosalinactinospora lopnorensis TaxID=1352348 RepID=UPI000A696FC0|nr:DUF3017 domain-containing protein [Allosalinactinospora lopnorensis]